MASQIEEAINVLSKIRERFLASDHQLPVSELRVKATKSVSEETGRTVTTIHNALARRLDLNAPKIDALVEKWLFRNLPDLRDVFLQHARVSEDRESIQRFFSESPSIGSPGPSVISEDRNRSREEPTTRSRTSGRKRKPIAVVLDDDVAEVFSSSKSVNDVLRSLIKIARKAARKTI